MWCDFIKWFDPYEKTKEAVRTELKKGNSPEKKTEFKENEEVHTAKMPAI